MHIEVYVLYYKQLSTARGHFINRKAYDGASNSQTSLQAYFADARVGCGRGTYFRSRFHTAHVRDTFISVRYEPVTAFTPPVYLW